MLDEEIATLRKTIDCLGFSALRNQVYAITANQELAYKGKVHPPMEDFYSHILPKALDLKSVLHEQGATVYPSKFDTELRPLVQGTFRIPNIAIGLFVNLSVERHETQIRLEKTEGLPIQETECREGNEKDIRIPRTSR